MSDEQNAFTPQQLAPWTVKQKYQPVFGAVQPWRVEADWVNGYFLSARMIVGNIADTGFEPQHAPTPATEGIAGIYLFRHYLELALKHLLFHSRWLRDQSANQQWNAVKEVAKTHSLHRLWVTIQTERTGKMPEEIWDGHDTAFVEACVADFEAVDGNGETFRYHGPVFGISQNPAAANVLHINFELLSRQMTHVWKVLSSLDLYCLNKHGFNDEWDEIVKSF